jgi:hypothetical protein
VADGNDGVEENGLFHAFRVIELNDSIYSKSLIISQNYLGWLNLIIGLQATSGFEFE